MCIYEWGEGSFFLAHHIFIKIKHFCGDLSMRQFIKFCLFLFVGLGSCSSWASLEKHDDRGRLEGPITEYMLPRGTWDQSIYKFNNWIAKEDQDSLPSILRGKGIAVFFTVPQDRFLSSTKKCSS